MKLIINPPRSDWEKILERPYADNRAVMDSVQEILMEVKKNGDESLRAFTKKFDGVELENFLVEESEIDAAENELTDSLRNAIRQADLNIEKFHRSQLVNEEKTETMPGVQCWRKSVAIEKIGLYIPGGSAPLFSTVLMLGKPAAIAGCKEIILCSPVNASGKLHPAILFTAKLVGINKIYKIGGAQAIAAMAFGTESIPAVYKIFGPGNQYVTAAKQLVQMQGIAIDMPAGPSEVCVLADESADPSYVAADLLSQAEHGADSQVLLVTTEEDLFNKVNSALEKQLADLPRKEFALKALTNSKAILVNTIEDAVEIVNAYAAEHLIISCKDAEKIAEKIISAGSVFIGNYSPESVGDYASGTNHTLPTNGFAKSYSGVSVDSFVKKISFQQLSKQGLERIASTVLEMAQAEGLQAHANAVSVRLK